MSKLLKILFTLAVTGIVFGAAVYLYTFYKPHRNLTGEKAVAQIEAAALLAAFESNEQNANISYLDKAIEVTGIIGEITPNETTYTVNLKVEGVDFGGVKCTLEPVVEGYKAEDFALGQSITLKGQCTGWINDEDLELKEVSLTRCIVIK